MEDIEDLILRMRRVAGENLDDPVVQARTAVLTYLLHEHFAGHPLDEQERLRRLLEGFTQALEELGPKAYLDELFERANEIAATRH